MWVLIGYKRGEQVRNEWQGKAELLANAIDLRWSDEDELGDRDNVTGGDKRGGPRRIPGNNTVESKAKDETRSGTHHEHDDGLGAVGDTLE